MLGPHRGAHRRLVEVAAKRAIIVFLSMLLAVSGVPARAVAGEAASVPVALAVPTAADASSSVSASGTGEGSDPAGASSPSSSGDAVAGSTSDATPSQSGANGSGEGSADGAGSDSEVQRVDVDVEIIGPDEAGDSAYWYSAAQRVPEGSTAADASEAAFEQAGLTADYGSSSWGWSLNSITSPYTGKALAWDAASGSYWQLFVNGEMAQLGAGSITLKAGDAVAWVYSSDGKLPSIQDQKVAVTVKVTGATEADAAGRVYAEPWLSGSSLAYRASERATAITAFRTALEDAGYELGVKESSWGSYIDSVTTPAGRVLAGASDYSSYWSFLVNGEAADTGAGSYELKDGDEIELVYLVDGKAPAAKPDDGGVTVDPGATRPDWTASWPGYGATGGTTEAAVPTGATAQKWVLDLKDSSDWSTYLSDPIAVGGFVYAVAGSALVKVDPATGKEVARAKLAAKADSISRMVYASGVIVVPLDGGRLQAITPDALATVWLTDPLPAGPGGAQQALSTLTVSGDKVLFATGDGAWGDPQSGFLACVDLGTGRVAWTRESSQTGYYWAGAAVVGGYAVIGDDAGWVRAFDLASGKPAGAIEVSGKIRSTLVADGSHVYAVSNDGVLHRLSVAPDGGITEDAKVAFGSSSTSTPVLAQGKIIVGGASRDTYQNEWGSTSHYGALFIIDAVTLRVERTVTESDAGRFQGDSKSMPLVSVQGGGTYAYFTVNAVPGGIYRYALGSEKAELVYTPDEAHRNYSMGSIIAGADGTLYYVNDSGALFAVGSSEPEPVETARLTVSTTVKGASSDHEFTYTVKLGDASVSGTFDGVRFSDGAATFTLKAGQSKAFDLPVANGPYSYVVTQADADGFSVSPASSLEGVLKAGGSQNAAFTNEQAPRSLRVSVTVKGVDDPTSDDAQESPWVSGRPFAFKSDAAATAWDAIKDALDAGGFAYEAPATSYGVYIQSITSPDGVKLENSSTAPYSYWSFLVNGKMADVGVSGYRLRDGDEISLVYHVARTVATEVIGVDAGGRVQRWTAASKLEVSDGDTAATVSEALFKQAGIKADIQQTSYGWYLASLTSPFDGRTLGWDAESGRSWILFVNGKMSDLGAGSVKLKAGDAVAWVYTTYGASMPEDSDIQVDPTAKRPGYTAEHGQFARSSEGGNVVEAPTPSAGAALDWAYRFDVGSHGSAAGSDPLIVNGNVYVASGSKLRIVDPSTGKDLRAADLGAAIGYFCRPVYADGLIIVPREDGSLAAFTADTLTCAWVSPALEVPAAYKGKFSYQALSSLSVVDGAVIAGFTMVGRVGDISGAGIRGVLVSVDVETGSIRWQRVSDSSDTGKPAGYYWAGAASSGDDLIIGDEAGTVSVIDGRTGALKSSVDLSGGPVRAGIVAVPGQEGTFLAVARDAGSLVKLVLEDGALKIAGSVSFSAASTSTPAVSGGRAFVGGVDSEGYGTLSVIDIASMRVVTTVRGDRGASQGAPLVSVTGGETHAYFTCNGAPGGVWSYRLGDDAAHRIYTPAADMQQYTTSTVIADARGNLYYANDVGYLFKLHGAASWKVTFDLNGAGASQVLYVVRGGRVAAPADPVRAGYAFGGWYVDAAMTRPADFSQPVTSDLHLYAKWVRSGEGGEDDGTHDDGGSKGPAPQGGENAPIASGDGGGDLVGGVAPTGLVPLTRAIAPSPAVGATGSAVSPDAAATLSATASGSDAAPAGGQGALSSDSGTSAASRSRASDDGAVTSGVAASPVPYIVGGVGVIGLILAAVWLFLLKRRA